MLKVDTARLAGLSGSVSVGLRIEAIAQVPLLKDVAAESPERAVTRENTMNGISEQFRCVGIEAIDELKAHITMECWG